MRKQVSPTAAIALIVVVVLIAGFFFWKAAKGKKMTGIVPGVGPVGRQGARPYQRRGPEQTPQRRTQQRQPMQRRAR